MLVPKLSLIAEGVIRDVATNSISVFNILEGLAAQGFPFFLQHLNFFVLWEKAESDPSVFEGTFSIKNNSVSLIEDKFKIDFEGKLRSRSIINVNGLLIKEPGILKASLNFNGVEAEYSVSINPMESAIKIQNNL